MPVLVTGGAGFIGSHLVDALVGKGEEVTVFDDFSTGHRDNLNIDLSGSRVRVVDGSVLDKKALEPLVAAAPVVFHLAAKVGVKRVCADPRGTLETNINGTAAVFDLCQKHGAKMVFASTSEVYGKNSRVPLDEKADAVLGQTTVARWSYALSKMADEYLVLTRKTAPAVILRYFNSYGPRVDPTGYGGVVAVFIDQALKGAPISVYGDGRQTRSFTYISDTVEATIAAADRTSDGVYNVGRPDEIAINELAEAIVGLTASRSEIVHKSYPKGWGQFEETRRRSPNIDRARAALGFDPRVSLTTGLEKTVDWMRRRQHGSQKLGAA